MGNISNLIIENKRLCENNNKISISLNQAREEIVELNKKLKEDEHKLLIACGTNYAFWLAFQKQLDIFIATNEPITKVKEYLQQLKDKKDV